MGQIYGGSKHRALLYAEAKRLDDIALTPVKWLVSGFRDREQVQALLFELNAATRDRRRRVSWILRATAKPFVLVGDRAYALTAKRIRDACQRLQLANVHVKRIRHPRKLIASMVAKSLPLEHG